MGHPPARPLREDVHGPQRARLLLRLAPRGQVSVGPGPASHPALQGKKGPKNRIGILWGKAWSVMPCPLVSGAGMLLGDRSAYCFEHLRWCRSVLGLFCDKLGGFEALGVLWLGIAVSRQPLAPVLSLRKALLGCSGTQLACVQSCFPPAFPRRLLGRIWKQLLGCAGPSSLPARQCCHCS